MSIFFNFKTQQVGDSKSTVVVSSWHTIHSYLAVGYDNGVVAVYNEEGDRIDQSNSVRPTTNIVCTCVAWHPTLKLLCTGWKDGGLFVWVEGDGSKDISLMSGYSPHSDRFIATMGWNANGTRLVSVDRIGTVAVWKQEQKHRFSFVRCHEFKCTLTQIVFRNYVNSTYGHKGEYIEGGGYMEDILEEDKAPIKVFNRECTFVLGSQEGNLHMMDDIGNTVGHPTPLESAVSAILYHQEKDNIVCLTSQSFLHIFSLLDNSFRPEKDRVKVATAQSAADTIGQMLWVGAGLLVICNNECFLRVWNLYKDEHYLLHLTEQEEDGRKSGLEKLSCASYNPRKRVLAGGTKEGRIVFWQFVGHGSDSSVNADDWEAFAEIDLETGVQALNWGPGETLLSASMTDSVSILHETILKRKMLKGTAIIQLSPECVFVEVLDQKFTQTIRSSIRIKGLDICGNHFCVWDGKVVEIWQVNGNQSVQIHHLDPPLGVASAVAVHSEFIFIAKSTVVEVFNYQLKQGLSLKQTLSFSENEGLPMHLDVHGDHLVVVSSTNHIKMWRILNEVKQKGPAKQVFPEKSGIQVTSVKCNSNGTKVSFLCRTQQSDNHSTSDTKLYVYDTEDDRVGHYDFAPVSRVPISHCWDETEPKLLGCETRRLRSDSSDASDDGERASRIEVVTLFATNESRGVVLQDSFPLDKNVTALIGLNVPNLYFYARFLPAQAENDRESHIEVKPMPNFDGITITSPQIRDALLKFSYFLTIGNMDEAYKAVKQIKDQNVWHNMAVMCVKTKRLDVAEVCLGNTQDAIAARALRDVKERESQLEVQVATLAIHLGQLEEAERLYRQCKRYDLLCQMYQSCGKWELALATAEQYDRIHLRSIHYNYARHLESLGDLEAAQRHYERSKTNKHEVPRILYGKQAMRDLETYIATSADKDLLSWWAQYNESIGQFNVALNYYREADDILSLVRLNCFLGNVQYASDLVQKSQNSAAAYHLAKQCEEQGDLKDAIKYFSLAKAYRHAITLARRSDMDQEVMDLAMLANYKPTMIEAAQYFESKGMNDKAVMLYQKGGNLQRAIDLCVSGRLFDTLDAIADNLDSETTPKEVFISCAKFFLENEVYSKACKMFVLAKAYTMALSMCEKHEVQLTVDMAEQMTLEKSEDTELEATRCDLLYKIAKVAKKQGNYHLACKKYTQAGAKVKAMKALLKSGDKEKIIFFATHSKNKEIYILAANFLQSLDWHNDKEIMSKIVFFYQKAKAVEKLANFCDAIAQVEIDDCRDYDRALSALKESEQYLRQSKERESAAKLENLLSRIGFVERFVNARKLVKTDPSEMVRKCLELLNEHELDAAVRVGDVFALLVEFHSSKGDMRAAFEMIEKMRERGIQLNYFLDGGLLEQIYKSVGAEFTDDSKIHEGEDFIDETIS